MARAARSRKPRRRRGEPERSAARPALPARRPVSRAGRGRRHVAGLDPGRAARRRRGAGGQPPAGGTAADPGRERPDPRRLRYCGRPAGPLAALRRGRRRGRPRPRRSPPDPGAGGGIGGVGRGRGGGGSPRGPRPASPPALPAPPPSPAPPPLLPPFPGAPEEVHPWGRGRVTVIPVDPFRAHLPPDDAAMWTRLLGEPRTPPFVARTLLDVLPQTPGTSLSLQVVILLTLGLYLILLRPLTRGLVRGRSGWALAAALLVGVTAVTATLNLAVRRGASTIVQGVVAVALPDQGVALVESVGRVLLSRRGAFQLRAGAETLVRPLAGAETTLVLNQVVRFEGRAGAALPGRAGA